MRKGTYLILLLLLFFCRLNATDYYVSADVGSNTSGDGTSGNPWMTITYALSQVSGSGHIIHVAGGYYDSSLGESFPIYVKNGISIDGAGDSITVIDAGGVDGYSVLNCVGITDPSTYVEGFFITGGYYYDNFSVGAGIFISAGSVLTIKNNTVYDNYLGTWGTGGGIYIINSSPKIISNLIASNGSDYWGDGNAMAIINSSPLVQGNDIVYNINDESYSCIYVEGTTSSPRFVNNVIALNSGTGLYLSAGVPTIINNTISENAGCGIYLTGDCEPDSVINNIISYNSEYGIQEGNSGYDPVIVSYNMFYANGFGLYYNEGSTAIYTVSTLNTVAECENNIEGDPLYVDWYNGDYHLSAYSPAVDAGHPLLPFDNEPEPNGGRINMGAYGNTSEATVLETPPVLPVDLYVNAVSGSNTTGDGTSGNPWQTITYALSQIFSTGHIVHVAAGTYNEALGESFPVIIKNGVSLSGENNTTTIIDATGAGQRVLHCIGITDITTVIEGFTITGGYLSDYGAQGAGIYISAGSLLTLRNNIIMDNNLTYSSHGYGAGIFITNSLPFIISNIIRDNSALYGYGAAISAYNSSPRIRGNIILSNTGTSTYSSVYFYGTSGNPEMTRNLVARNTGDAISVSGSENLIPKFINNTISDNAGNGIILSNCIPDSITNNIFSYNVQFGIYESGASSDPGIVSYNLFYANSAGLYYDEGSTEYYSAATLNSNVPECTDNIDGDPVYKDRPDNDYRLNSTSAAINAGDPDYPTDPDGSRIEIGAYRFTIPPPDPPVATEPSFTGQTDFIASWNSSATSTGYFLDVANDFNFTVFVNNFENRDVQNVTSYCVTGLSSNTTLYYRVRAYNDGGESSSSNMITVTTTVDPPAPPASAPVAYAGTDITQTSFLADWDAVDDATSYKIEVSDDNTFGSHVPGYNYLEIFNATEVNVTGLTSGTQYYYTVYGCNSGGCGPTSDTIMVETLPDPPPAPYITSTNNITQTSFTGTWFSSATATGYYLDVATDDAFTLFVSGYENLDVDDVTSYNVTGLTSNTTYYYRITAYNSGGNSDYSDFSGVTTLPDPPAPPLLNDPTNVSQTNFTVNWESSATATGYVLDVATDETFTIASYVTGFENLDVGNVTSYNVTGLSKETTYYYRLRAYNTGGTSPDSEVWSLTTLPDPPSAPVALEASDTTQTDFTANWESVSDATGYYLDVATDDAFTTYVTGYESLDVLSVTSYSVTGLNPNTAYYYRLRAYNSGGNSSYSNTVSVVTLQVAVPDAPVANDPFFIGQTDLTASWNSSATATGYYLDVCYDIDFTNCINHHLDVGDVTSYSIMGLTANTTYYYRVFAYNDGGSSGSSNIISLTTLGNPPDPPSTPAVYDAINITQTTFTANWGTETDATGYLLDVGYDNIFSNVVFQDMDLTNKTSYDVSALTSNTTYYYRVRAYNSGGTSDYSEIITVTTLPDPPPIPVVYSATNITTTGFTANWDDMERTDGYKLSVTTDEFLTQFVEGYNNLDVYNVLSYEVTGLNPNTTYYCCVSGYNAGGESGMGHTPVTTLLTMPDVPDAPTADPATVITQTTFQANWTPSSGTDGVYLDVAYDSDFSSYVTGYQNLDIGYDVSLDISGLNSNTTYYYRLRGYNVSGTGSNSNVVSVTTLPDPPPAPTGLSASSCNDEVYLQWNQSAETDFVKYNLYYGTGANPTTLLESYAPESYNTITIEGLTHGETYYFRVTQVISPDVESDYSSNASVKVKKGVIPRIKAKWNKVLICYNPNDSLQTFQWFVGTSAISGATGQYYVVSQQSGFYYVVTSDQDGCYNHSNLINISGSKSVTLYPNPAKSYFTLNLSSEIMGETVISLYNSTGVKSLEYRTGKTDTDLNCEIPAGSLKDGIYTVEIIINDEEINYTRLVIIE